MHEEDAMPLDREFSQLAANQNSCLLFGHQSMELSNLDEIQTMNKEISNGSDTTNHLRVTEPSLGMPPDEEVKGANFDETYEDWDR